MKYDMAGGAAMLATIRAAAALGVKRNLVAGGPIRREHALRHRVPARRTSFG